MDLKKFEELNLEIDRVMQTLGLCEKELTETVEDGIADDEIEKIKNICKSMDLAIERFGQLSKELRQLSRAKA